MHYTHTGVLLKSDCSNMLGRIILVRDMTSIPVPDVLAWSSDASNPVGAEYMVLEKCAGRQLNTIWGELDELRRFKLVKSIAGFDRQLASIKFPAYGNLYFRAFGTENELPVDTAKDVQGIYCLGPVFSDSWPRNPESRKGRDIDAGPCESPFTKKEFFLSRHV